MQELQKSLKPYHEGFLSFSRLPEEGCGREEILREMEKLKSVEEARWKEGRVSGAVYHGDSGHVDFLNQVYALNSQSNPLHADVWPSTTKFEAEIVAMTANMLGADADPGHGVCGTVTSGGTESILVAMKTYRDWARETKGITAPEMVAPATAHAAFDKAAQYFGIKIIRIPVGPDFRADVVAARNAITANTIVLIGSAPPFPHGLVDPIEELSELAREHGLGFHTDGCLGGFLLPWAEKLGYPVPRFDFRLPGVTSISADTHKYGYAAKGTSVVLYRNAELRHFQYYTTTDWPGGLYFSPTLAGSRPGGLSAACWAALVTLGESGYLRAAGAILETAATIKQGLREIPELQLIGDPLFVIAFMSETLDIFQVMEAMTRKGWGLNGLHFPPAVHICVTLRHTQPGLGQRLIADLKEAVAYVKGRPDAPAGVGPVYGMASVVELRGMVSELLRMYMDVLYQV
ncbi:MAG: aminotransferase class V-fold PLP-dependent enzyme [Chloroflexi bacterium]|nr:aminotransferase class V-fold PLP-dependent enzyme [Chloroflexota bacterium]